MSRSINLRSKMEKCTCDFVVNSFVRDNLTVKHYETCAINLKRRSQNGEFPNGLPRDDEGYLQLVNPNLSHTKQDFLYHLALNTGTHDLRKMFGDVKFVCMGGTIHRMKELALAAAEELGINLPVGSALCDISIASLRYCLYKIGPILSINHGVGMSTLSVVLQEVIKLLQYSKCKDPIIFRVGTSGGVDVEPGTVVISNKAFDGMLKETYDLPVLGKIVSWPAIFDSCLAEELQTMAQTSDGFKAVIGGTMGANCFYNGQGRTDGAFCEYSNEEKMNYLRKMQKLGIKNIEMEAPLLAALTHKAGIKTADVCVTLLNRLEGDQVTTPKTVLLEYEKRPMQIIFRYMKKYLENIGRYPYGDI